MEKTIMIGEKEVRLSNNIGWAIAYRDQFGRDIVPAITPLVAAALDIVSGLIDEKGVISTADILRSLDGDKFLDAVIHLSGLEFVDLINIIWSMAKVCEDIPEPRVWVRRFEVFPLDEILPAVIPMIVKGLMTTKNWERLKSLGKAIQPSVSTQFSSPDSSEG